MRLLTIQAMAESNKISEVECIFPDMAGSSKGKILPVQRFIKSIEDQSLKLGFSFWPDSVRKVYMKVKL